MTTNTNANKSTKQRKKRDKTTIDYFDENKFRDEILPNIHDSNFILPDSFIKDMFAIADGMINTEFRANNYVLFNRDELKNECIFEILKSLKRFNCQKGRAFAYFNRIIKNTLLKFYYKNNRINSKETGILDIIKSIDDEDSDITTDEAFSSLKEEYRQDLSSVNNSNSQLFENLYDTDASKINKLSKKDQNINVVESATFYYMEDLVNKINIILYGNKNILDKFLNKLKFNEDISENINNDNILKILRGSRNMFLECLHKTVLDKKLISRNVLKKENSILINYKVTVYVKNKISNKNIRTKYNKVLSNYNLSRCVLKEILEF